MTPPEVLSINACLYDTSAHFLLTFVTSDRYLYIYDSQDGHIRSVPITMYIASPLKEWV